ncbi:hypothetical protein Mgra_00004790 [Meloidogyne graminicola]|uniref:Uncharacterized protein n=1 Tax=Meloidogyne graminicola TaxID=189291 RepID=A0A8S9ZQI3_9BILA|nr:hypothetical protein Mgra_00004790 [Meloidogyne graminicola]
MFFTKLLKIFLLFFITFSQQKITDGMYNPPDKFKKILGMQASSSTQVPQEEIPFSFTELTLLTRILHEITVEDVYSNNLSIQNIFWGEKDQILIEHELYNDHPVIVEFTSKLKKIFNHFESILDNYQYQLNQFINNMDIYTIRWFINKRLLDYRRLNYNNYKQFFSEHGLNLKDLPENHKKIDSGEYIFSKFSDDQLGNLMKLLRPISQKEKNLFHFYKLHLLVRKLIKLFIQNWANSYLLAWKDYEDQLSIISYIIAFDEAELVSNEIYEIFKDVKVFHLIKDDQVNMKSLQMEEDLFSLPVLFEHNDNIYMIKLSYFFKRQTDRTIAPEHFDNFEPFRIGKDTYNLYKLYYSNYVSKHVELKAKLEQYYINEQLINEMRRQFNENNVKYDIILVDMVADEYDDNRDEIYIMPQTREIQIENYHQNPNPSRRRRQREGGNGGNGGSGSRQRGRHSSGGGNGSRDSHGRGRK